jgi:hypothetical protein
MKPVLCGLIAAVSVTLCVSRAHATDFFVPEVVAGTDVKGRSMLGAGATFDIFSTAGVPIPRGALLGLNVDALYCQQCAHRLSGVVALPHLFLTWWKDDTSVVTPYIGLSGGGGYSNVINRGFGQIEGQLAVQSRALYQGWWLRPSVFVSYSGAYGLDTTVGLRVSIGFAVNHGKRVADCPDIGQVPPEACSPPPIATGLCDPPASAAISNDADTYVIPNCDKKGATATVDGVSTTTHEVPGQLIITVGKTAPNVDQKVDVTLAGGKTTTRLARRVCK